MIQKRLRSCRFEPGEDTGTTQKETGRKSLNTVTDCDTISAPVYQTNPTSLRSSLLEQKAPRQRLGEAAGRRRWGSIRACKLLQTGPSHGRGLVPGPQQSHLCPVTLQRHLPMVACSLARRALPSLPLARLRLVTPKGLMGQGRSQPGHSGRSELDLNHSVHLCTPTNTASGGREEGTAPLPLPQSSPSTRTQPRGGCTPRGESPRQAPRRGRARPGVEAGAVGEGAEVVVAHEVSGPDGPRATLRHEAPLDAEVGPLAGGFGGGGRGHRRRLTRRPAHQQRRQQQQRPAARTPPPHGRRPRHGGPRTGQPQGAH